VLTGPLYRLEPGRGGGPVRETAGGSGLLYFTGFRERRQGGRRVMEARPGDNGLAFSRRKEKREWPSWAEWPGGPEWCLFGLAGRPWPREGHDSPRGGKGRGDGLAWRRRRPGTC
jgi:hypothetical protein